MPENEYDCCNNVIGNKRYFIAILTCFGLLIPLAMRCEIGIAIIKMTEFHNIIVPTNASNTSSPMAVLQVREVSWSNTKVSLIEASFYIGYTLFSIPGGFLSTIFPPNIMFGSAVLFSAIINMIIPSLVKHKIGFASVFIFRIFQGMAEGCLYPTVQSFWRHWAPRQERSKLVTISFFGMAIGPVIGYPISGILTKQFDWTADFYFWGVLAIIWVCIWFSVSRSSPAKDRCISESERLYIENNTSQIIVKASEVPWISILTSVPVWAIIVANVGRNWTYQFSFSGLPSFLRDKFHDSSVNMGLHMSSPYVLMAVLTPLGGIVADCMIKRQYSITFVRRCFNTVGFGMAGCCFIILGFVPYLWMATTVLTLGLGFFGIGISGFGVNHLDIADIYAGVLMGISNGFGTLAGILAPIVAMQITKHNSVARGWMIYFLISGVIHIVTVLFFLFFSSGVNQPWSKNKMDKDEEDTTENEEVTSEKEKILGNIQ